MSPTGPHQDAATDSPGGYGRLAQRIAKFSLNLIATAGVLLIMLLLGGQLTDYWRSATVPSTTGALGAVTQPTHSAGDGAVTVKVGNGKLTLTQAEVVGNQQSALDALRHVCRQALQTVPEGEPLGESQPSELALLKLIEAAPPAALLDQGRELHVLPGAVPMAVVTVPLPAVVPPPSTAAAGESSNGEMSSKLNKNPAPAAPANVAAPRRRVVVWGIALPSGEKRWAAYAFRPGAEPGEGTGSAAERLSLPTPAGARRVLSVRQPRQPAITALSGPATADAENWRKFYDRWSEDAGYEAAGPWQVAGGNSSAQFSRRQGAATQGVEILFGPDGHGGLRGIITQSTDTANGGQSQ